MECDSKRNHKLCDRLYSFLRALNHFRRDRKSVWCGVGYFYRFEWKVKWRQGISQSLHISFDMHSILVRSLALFFFDSIRLNIFLSIRLNRMVKRKKGPTLKLRNIACWNFWKEIKDLWQMKNHSQAFYTMKLKEQANAMAQNMQNSFRMNTKEC